MCYRGRSLKLSDIRNDPLIWFWSLKMLSEITYLSDDSDESYRSAHRFFRRSSISCKSMAGIGGGGGSNAFASFIVNPTCCTEIEFRSQALSIIFRSLTTLIGTGVMAVVVAGTLLAFGFDSCSIDLRIGKTVAITGTIAVFVSTPDIAEPVELGVVIVNDVGIVDNRDDNDDDVDDNNKLDVVDGGDKIGNSVDADCPIALGSTATLFVTKPSDIMVLLNFVSMAGNGLFGPLHFSALPLIDSQLAPDTTLFTFTSEQSTSFSAAPSNRKLSAILAAYQTYIFVASFRCSRLT